MTWEQLCKLGLELPEVVEDVWFRTPALKVRGKAFVRLKEDGASVVFMLESVDEQEFLITARSDVYFITDHYRGYPAVLARLSALRLPECRARLKSSWRLKAPRKLVAQLEGGDSAPEPRGKPQKTPRAKQVSSRAKSSPRPAPAKRARRAKP
ncbi:MmcQ/YjbR family DNA-binding protein [Pyxidicoccus xibeiensis]|uniref:MmcQ/YjbR family DNA-binding protein n=1 Tax=Pyxidicoccus xibeiensis TaxID=2906759 RepID=UPI0020A744C8|nr:MmcQ/YjbR family DNA-binding protein [Pyxidicoccus xibeiensis]MCP3140391.1 MmcQ/YjbR family DNA-binding protein [Pyxidicoccus xibeiensis]